jgi:hypothetical protein
MRRKILVNLKMFSVENVLQITFFIRINHFPSLSDTSRQAIVRRSLMGLTCPNMFQVVQTPIYTSGL